MKKNTKLVKVEKVTIAARGKTPTEAFEEFLNLDCGNGRASKSTVANYKLGVRDFLAWVQMQALRIEEITPTVIKQYRECLINQYSTGTVALRLTCVRRFFDSLVANSILITNPALGIKAPKPEESPIEKVKYIPEDKGRALIEECDTKDPIGIRDRAILSLFLRHGLRVSEIANMETGWIDGDVLHVTGKGRKVRTIHLTSKSKTDLEAWLSIRPNDTEFVFCGMAHNQKQNSLTRKSIWKMVKSYMKRIGIDQPRIGCHALRHTYATAAARHGASMRHLQDSLGHASPETTGIYAKIVDAEKHNPALLLEEVF